MRAAGFFAGLLTAILDLLKSAVCVWIARALLPGVIWLEVLAPILAILGHNYSVFLMSRDAKGKFKLRGGAGGAPTVGGAFGLWPPSLFIIVPIAVVMLFGVGYASLATMSVALIAAIIFAIRAAVGSSPWVYVLYGVLAELLLMWALRPNIQRLLKGNERVVGWRARRMKQDKDN